MSRTIGGFCKRPILEILRSKNVGQSRGMKVRSSVKKLCDGCKVRREVNPFASVNIAKIATLDSKGI